MNKLTYLYDSQAIFLDSKSALNESYASDVVRERESLTWGRSHSYDKETANYFVNYARVASSRLIKPKSNEITVCVSYLASDRNIFHWCNDVLTRIILLKYFSSELSYRCIRLAIVTSKLSSYQAATLQACIEYIRGFLHSVEVILLPIGDYTFEDCVHITVPNCPFYYRRIVEDLSLALKSSILRNSKTSSFKGEKIFLVRKEARNSRQIVNLKEVSRLLSRMGFTLVDPALLKPKAQAEIFADSRVVVGTHGAAFVNMLFGGNQNMCIELSPSSYRDVPTFYIAEVLGIEWTRFVAPSVCTHTHAHLLNWDIIQKLQAL